MSKRVLLISILVSLCCVSLSFAQERSDLRTGQLVRATLIKPDVGTMADPKVITGTLREVTDTSLTLETSASGAPRVIPRENLAGLEVNLREGRRRKGALIGLGAGVVLGVGAVLIADATRERDPDDWDLLGTQGMAVFSGFALGSLGALLGAVIAPGAVWGAVPSDGLQLGADAGPQGAGRVYLAVRF